MLAFFVILGFLIVLSLLVVIAIGKLDRPECIWCGTLEQPLITITDKNFEPRYFVCHDCLDVHGVEF